MCLRLSSLRYDGVHNCAGSLLTSRHLLTAAHCFRSKKKAGLWRAHIPGNPLYKQTNIGVSLPDSCKLYLSPKYFIHVNYIFKYLYILSPENFKNKVKQNN